MKHKFLNLILPALLLLGMWSCKKEETKIYLESNDPVTLTASSTAPLVLMQSNAGKTAVSFSWTNPNYRFTTGPSSQNVTYTLQVDTTGASFTNPNRQEVAISKDLGVTYTVKDLNILLGKMNLQENMPHQLEFRVKAAINGSAPVYSNVVKMTVTPYLDVAVALPASGKLYITGSATPGSWMGGGDPELASQRFTKVNSTQYEIVLPLSAGNSFLFVPVYGDWSNKYGYDGSNNSNNVYGDNFKVNGGDMKAPPETATYKITVNFKTGKYTVVKQ